MSTEPATPRGTETRRQRFEQQRARVIEDLRWAIEQTQREIQVLEAYLAERKGREKQSSHPGDEGGDA